jgi:hypothetical protein
MIYVVVHISNEDAIKCEMDEMPAPDCQFVLVHNPQKRDGQDVHYLDEGVTSMMIPWHRINFIQLLPSGEEEDVIGFVRE